MSVSGGQRLELEDGLQVLEVAGRPGQQDAGRVNEAVTAHETREVWAIGATDPHNLEQAGNVGEAEFNITRGESSIDNPEVSTALNAEGTGHSYNETVWEFGFSTADTIAGETRLAFRQTYIDSFPVPIVWQEDETWHFTFFVNTGSGNPSHEMRVYFTSAEREVVPMQTRSV